MAMPTAMMAAAEGADQEGPPRPPVIEDQGWAQGAGGVHGGPTCNPRRFGRGRYTIWSVRPEMTFGSVERQVVPEGTTLEVRWILPGTPPAAVLQWFGRLSARTETREDLYLLNPRLEGLSMRIRGDALLEVKHHLGSSGIFELPGRASGRMSS
jgi:hypothetical protein